MSQVVDLHATAFGDQGGDTVVLLHGLLGSGRNLAARARSLSDRWRVIVPDLRNHGESPWVDEMNYPAMVADVVRLLDRNGVDRAAVVGHSMGGKVAQAMALTHPDRVLGMVVVDIALRRYEHSFAHLIDAMLAVPLARCTRRSDVDRYLAAMVPDRRTRLFLLTNLARDTRGNWCWRPNLRVLLEQGDAIAAGVCTVAPCDTPRDLAALYLCG
ncbi:MAG: alpha/beta fold hydrolase, partial [Candidatus Dadabacteria bacterium]